MENKAKFTTIALAILLILFIGYSAYATYTIIDLRNDLKNIENTANTKDDNQIESESTSNSNTSEKTLKEYIHPLYPEVKIKYDNSWKLEIKEEEFTMSVFSSEFDSIGTKTSVKNVLIELEKDSTKIKFHMSPSMMYGSECSGFFYTKEEKSINQLENGWFRIESDTGYDYIRNAVFHGTEDYETFAECALWQNQNADDYDFGIYDDAGTVVTEYNHEGLLGLLYITIEVNSDNDSELLKEADEIVTQSSYGFYIK
ncbi:MAG TPA: hypothetical protein PK957_00375 [Candidatus Dojkabacteria bacterium]|nr:hypothetical protein [Candidatus Dojkabacteria bacterium]HQF37344.1 hypothetical protein [Candidatus Dojkabacteria bacterium]